MKNEDNKQKPVKNSLSEAQRKIMRARLEKSKRTSVLSKFAFALGLPTLGALLIFYLVATGKAKFDAGFFLSMLGKVFVLGLLAGVMFAVLFIRISRSGKLKFKTKLAVWILFFASLYTGLLILLPENVKQNIIKLFFECINSLNKLL